jgi:hypothetical protein
MLVEFFSNADRSDDADKKPETVPNALHGSGSLTLGSMQRGQANGAHPARTPTSQEILLTSLAVAVYNSSRFLSIDWR